MGISISYEPRRSEVWRYYWRLWRSHLWKIHLRILVPLVASGAFAIYAGGFARTLGFYELAAAFLVPIGFAFFPMLVFTPGARTLVADDTGISATVGKRDMTVPWSDVTRVEEEQDTLVIQRRNLNAFIVPARAFQSAEDRLRFHDFVREKSAGARA